jgi:preprotein translocase subunit SecA
MRRLTIAWRLAKWRRRFLPAVSALGRELADLDDTALRRRSQAVAYRSRSGEDVRNFAPEAFALVRESARRTLGKSHYDVQMLGGAGLLDRAIVEMQTGEGKTLTAILPAYTRALAKKGMHVATANDYLAARDAELMTPVYGALGLTVGVVTSETKPEDRGPAYRCDVTYGTAKEFGFDFLRDRLTARGEPIGGVAPMRDDAVAPGRLQRPPYCMLVDEADSVLIDEAGTPLILGGPTSTGRVMEEACYRWAAAIAPQMIEGADWRREPPGRAVRLTSQGRTRLRGFSRTRELNDASLAMLYDYVERAVVATIDYQRERHYVVRDDEVVIIDEFTGRPGEGRRWQKGIHEAIEAKENLKIQISEGHIARITVQEFFRRYPLLCGMTGTAETSWREFRRIYRTAVIPIPTHRPCIRKRLPTVVKGTAEAKWQAVVDEVRAVRDEGRAVLIGTRSIDKSEHLSSLLAAAGIKHAVLNARRLKEEADIVAQAGHAGHVTVATNMAGRGTDIELEDDVAERGGLHVIATELHESPRIDRQLFGRAARQGDPGSYRQFLALDDEILSKGFGAERAARIAKQGAEASGPLESWEPQFVKAQRKLESKRYVERRKLMHYEEQRNKMFDELGLDVHLDTTD